MWKYAAYCVCLIHVGENNTSQLSPRTINGTVLVIVLVTSRDYLRPDNDRQVGSRALVVVIEALGKTINGNKVLANINNTIKNLKYTIIIYTFHGPVVNPKQSVVA